MLFIGEQIGAGLQGAPRSVERVGFAAMVPACGHLDPAPPALIESIARQKDHMKRVHHRHRVGQLFGAWRS